MQGRGEAGNEAKYTGVFSEHSHQIISEQNKAVTTDKVRTR